MLPWLSSLFQFVSDLASSLTLAQTFNIGIRDSICPYGLSAVLIFVFLLFFIKKDKLPINTFCFFFIVGYILTVASLALGFFDVLLNNYLFTKIIQVSNAAVGLGFVIIGLINLNGWWRLKKNNAFNQLVIKALLFFSEETVEGKQLRWFRRNTLRLGSFCWGILAALLGSAWGPDKDFYIMFTMLSEDRNFMKGVWGMGIYGVVQAWIFIFIWVLFAYIRKSNKSKLLIEKYISIIKIAAAAVFMSVGAGITYLSFK